MFPVARNTGGEHQGVPAFTVHPAGAVPDLSQSMSADEIPAAGALADQGRPIIDPARDMKTEESGGAGPSISH